MGWQTHERYRVEVWAAVACLLQVMSLSVAAWANCMRMGVDMPDWKKHCRCMAMHMGSRGRELGGVSTHRSVETRCTHATCKSWQREEPRTWACRAARVPADWVQV